MDDTLEDELTQLSSEGAKSGTSTSLQMISNKKRNKDYVSGMNWVGAKQKLSNKGQLRRTDEQIKHALARLDKSLNCIQQQNAPSTKKMDEESLYCLRLAQRMRSFEPLLQLQLVLLQTCKHIMDTEKALL